MTEKLTLTPDQWEQRTGIRVMDPDGWREDGKPWTDPIDGDEWSRRVAISTVSVAPVVPAEDIDPASSGNDDAPDSIDPVMQWGVRWPDGGVTAQRDLEAAHATAGFWASLDEPPTVVSRICGPWSDSETQLGGLSRDS